jgi:hypothetical protein
MSLKCNITLTTTDKTRLNTIQTINNSYINLILCKYGTFSIISVLILGNMDEAQGRRQTRGRVSFEGGEDATAMVTGKGTGEFSFLKF